LSPKWSDIFKSSSSNSPKAKIELYSHKSKYSLGEQVTGSIKIISEEEFLVNQLNVCLSCNETKKKTRVSGSQYGTFQTEYWDSATIYNNSCKIFGNVQIPSGFNQTYPYAIDISFAAKETLYSIDHNVKWHLFALMEPVGRPHIRTQTYEIQVASPQVSHSSPIVKEVTREVVLIPCSYCSGLMPQTSIFCPNCGARRRA
jgi:hypothetical protein